MTVGEVISRIKESVKALTNDAFVTDRYVFSLLYKYAAMVLRQQDNRSNLKMINSMYQTVVIRLEEVDKIKDNCQGLTSCKEIKRSVEVFDALLEGYNGPIIKSVTSLDGSVELVATTPTKYNSIKRSKLSKYDKSIYYYFTEGRFYFPDLEWDEVVIEVASYKDLSLLGYCYSKNDTSLPECIPMQEQKFFMPEGLLVNIEQMMEAELANRLKVPPDENPDKLSINRD